jgi:hypothetical protein
MYIAVLEDDDRRREEMARLLAEHLPGCEAIFFDNAPDMIAWLKEHLSEVVLLCLDHDLGPNRTRGNEILDSGCGRDVVDAVAGHEPCCPVVIHTTNSYAAPGMVFALEEGGWRVERVVPFSDLEWLPKVWLATVRTQLTGRP